MKKTFRWNPYADQPHNVAPKGERFRHHLKHLPSYFNLAHANLRKAFPIIRFYRIYKKEMYKRPVQLEDPFALSFTSSEEDNANILECLAELDIKKCLIRIPSWKRASLDEYEKDVSFFARQGQEITISLLQQRDDIKFPARWAVFLEEVFTRFRKTCCYFELGHAWNRTKWGVWNYKEYLQLAEAALPYTEKSDIQIIGPAVIDFEFHLYPPVMKKIPFEKITSLLYVDRTGAPENPQFGWDLPRKIALLKAIIDSSQPQKKDLWITELNWPLEGTGKYSPAPGKSSVSESKQADYLVRYYVWSLASGFIQRIYWWQLAAPGYGLVDNRGKTWRKRPSYHAFKTMIPILRNSLFKHKMQDTRALIFHFNKNEKQFAVCWTNHEPFDYSFSEGISYVKGRDGKDIPYNNSTIRLNSSPQYVFFK